MVQGDDELVDCLHAALLQVPGVPCPFQPDKAFRLRGSLIELFASDAIRS
jgi:hypothetical protein